MTFEPKNGSWVDELESRGVLVRITEPMRPIPGGVTVICDSETNPTLIVPFEAPDCPVRLIANEAGVLSASPETRMQRKTGIDPMKAVLEPIVRSWREGIRRVLLCANPHSVAGPMLKMHTVELIDQMMRAAAWMCERVEDLKVGYIVHAPHEDGSYTNYFVEPAKWSKFYHWYEIQVIGRQDDPDPGYPKSASPPNFGGGCMGDSV